MVLLSADDASALSYRRPRCAAGRECLHLDAIRDCFYKGFIMRHSLVLTVIGPDRPGLVDLLSKAIKAREANWRESHLAQLAGQFAGIVHVDIQDDQADALSDDLAKLRDQGLRVEITKATASADRGADQGHGLRLEFLGLDRPGLVRDIAGALAARNINVTELRTQVVSAAMSGEQMFKAEATLFAPEGSDTDELEDALDQIARDLDLDLELGAAV